MIDGTLRWLVDEGTHLHDAHQIHDYLVEFPDLIEVVRETVRAAKRHFPGAQLILKVYSDPEIDDRYLALYVRLPGYDENTMDRIETAEAEFISLLANREGWIQLTTDFSNPKTE